MKLKDKKILLAVTGGIAAYKSAELCRLLIKSGADVRVIMSKAAREFITPLTMETLSGKKVPPEMFCTSAEPLEHIDAADSADIMLIAPATADYLARSAQGRASDLISSVTLAFTGQVIAAPAMNTNMWNNPATQRNLNTLTTKHDWHMVDPNSGELACGWSGTGRMAEPKQILAAVESMFNADLTGKRVLITAGPTVEDIDPVRFLSNRSSGTMGYAIATAAATRGAETILISGPTALPCPIGIEIVEVRSAKEMHKAVMKEAKNCDAVVMAAAVADYRPIQKKSHKIKKTKGTESTTLELVKNPDILADLGKQFKEQNTPVLVGFALETQNLQDAALAKLKAKNVDIIVANLAEDALEGSDTTALILDNTGAVHDVGSLSKRHLADRIWDLISNRLKKS